MTLRKGLDIWPCFIEINERRNLFVHTGGHVSDQYLKVCSEHNYDCGKTTKGDVLRVSPSYFKGAHACIFEVGVKLAHVLWRKLIPGERESADASLLVISYNLLVQEKYELACSILDFATDVLRDWSSDNMRLRFVINRSQAYKWSGDNAKAMSILDQEDFSAASVEYKLAVSVLKGDFKNAIGFVKAIGNRGSISLEDYREWPLFKEFRQQKELEKTILKVFRKPLNTIQVGNDGVPLGSPESVPVFSAGTISNDPQTEPRLSAKRKAIKSGPGGWPRS